MSYITQSDIEKRLSLTKLIQLTDFEGGGAVDNDRVSDCISAAEGILDSYCGGRYTLPLTVTAQIKDAALSICIYKLHSLRQLAPEKVRMEYEDAIAYLKDVAAGRATLDQSAISQGISAEVVTRDHTTDPEAFDDLRLADFIG